MSKPHCNATRPSVNLNSKIALQRHADTCCAGAKIALGCYSTERSIYVENRIGKPRGHVSESHKKSENTRAREKLPIIMAVALIVYIGKFL